jgi:hypothetical protein
MTTAEREKEIVKEISLKLALNTHIHTQVIFCLIFFEGKWENKGM